jgi:hypothetical protein
MACSRFQRPQQAGSPWAPRIQGGIKQLLVGGEDDNQRKWNRRAQENCANSHPWIMELPGRYQTESETADSKGGLQDGGSPVARRELAQGNLRATGHASWMLYQVDVNRPQHRPGYEVRYGYFGQGRQERL